MGCAWFTKSVLFFTKKNKFCNGIYYLYSECSSSLRAKNFKQQFTMENKILSGAKRLASSIITAAVLSTASLASGKSDQNLGGTLDSLTEQLKSAGNLAVVILFVFGLFCLYKIVQTVMNREDERSYPLKNIPLYFVGAAIGIGASISSEFVQNTIFGESSDKVGDDFFEVKK